MTREDIDALKSTILTAGFHHERNTKLWYARQFLEKAEKTSEKYFAEAIESALQCIKEAEKMEEERKKYL